MELFLFQGNMKQHMLTHKIRDMPQHMFENKPPISGEESSQQTQQNLPPREAQSGEGEQPNAPTQPAANEQNKEQPVKREPTETELPLPKRPPSKCFSFYISLLFLTIFGVHTTFLLYFVNL